jgi:serine/threonine-protein kinase
MTGTAGATSTAGMQGTAGAGNDGYFPTGSIWSTNVTKAPKTTDSGAITAWMKGVRPPHGFGDTKGVHPGVIRVDFSIIVNTVPAATAKRTYSTSAAFHYSPDCDTAPVPVPAGGAVEGGDGVFTSAFSGYACPGFAGGDDCHILLFAPGEKRLYEIYHGTIDAQNVFTVGCLAVWDTSTISTNNGRGQQCTSADAAGFPIAPLLFTPAEVKSGAINHAIRFTLQNDTIRMRQYVAPGTHATNTTGPATALPYAGHLRLRADYPLASLPSDGARVVARALQTYGMFMADGGTITLTASSDQLSTVKWSDVGIDAGSFEQLDATDFDVVDHGAPIDLGAGGGCTRAPITQ